MHFNNTSNVAGSGGAQARGVPDRQATVTAAEAFNGAFGVADLVISYRNQNDQVLRRPLIVAEGLDPGWITNPEEPEGNSDFASFIFSVANSGSFDLRRMVSGNPNVIGNPSDYDLVYINWRNGTTWLQRNALALEAVIRWVNANKQPDLVTGQLNPNVVLGSSMGGVIARMALGRMDRRQGPFNQIGITGFDVHQTNLYVSLDAPHQGANVPLGYQAAARHGAVTYLSTGLLPVIVETVQILRNGASPLQNLFLADQPASRQLLINRIDFFYNQANAVHQQFLQELNTQWAYPVNIRNIAISNGSECAIDQEFSPGSTLLYHFRSTKTRFVTDIFMMLGGAGLQAIGTTPLITAPLLIPGSSKFELTIDVRALASGGGNQVYFGKFKVIKKVAWLLPVGITLTNKTYTAPTGLLPFDNYPGGFYTVGLRDQPGTVSQDWMFTYNNSFYIQRRFSFIPTTSALDIGQGNVVLTNVNYNARYIGATPPIAPLNSPFANFATAFIDGPVTIVGRDPNTGAVIWQFVTNGCEPHEGFFIRNANWLAQEMNGVTTERTNCSLFCDNNAIAGNTTICNAETLTAPFGAGATYNWSVTNTALVTLTPNGNTVLVTRNGTLSGLATVTVNISGACGNTTLNIPITVGVPTTPLTIYGIPDNYNACANSNFNVTGGPSGGNAVWEIAGGQIISGQGSSEIFVQIDNTPGTGFYIGLRESNACGVSGVLAFKQGNIIDCDGGGGSTTTRIAPNPTSGEFVVTISDAKNSKALIKSILVKNKMGRLFSKLEFAKGVLQHTVNLSSLPADIYFIEVWDGKVWKTHKLVLNK